MEVERQTIIRELRTEASRDLLGLKLDTSHKSSERSQQLRNEGNALYKNILGDCIRHKEEVFKFYSDSIAFAPVDSDELAFGFSNRSAILFRMSKYRESALDIDKALKTGKSGNSIFKMRLLCRKAECLARLGLDECQDVYKEIESLMSQLDDNDKTSLRGVVEKAKAALKYPKKVSDPVRNDVAEHTQIFLKKEQENPFESIAIQHSPKYGRYLVANRDFEAGDIVYVEKPYVTVTSLNSPHVYCAHCMSVSWSMIPCDNCNWSMFCSESCKKEAWEQYHYIECVVFTQLKLRYEASGDIHVFIIRSIVLSIKKAGSIEQLRKTLQAIDNSKDRSTRGFLKNGSFEGASLESVYTLDDSVRTEMGKNDLKKCATKGAFILISLIRYTNLFGEKKEINGVESLLKNADALFIGSLIMKFYKIAKNNIQLVCGNTHSASPSEHAIKGFGIIPISCLFNHSCDPNIRRIMTRKGKLVAYALEPIKKNSQIFVNYCKSSYELPRPDRQKMLKQEHLINCDCHACKKNWLTAMQLFKAAPCTLRTLLAPIECTTMENILKQGGMKICTYNQETIRIISKAIKKVAEQGKQASVTLWNLKSSMDLIFGNLYYQDF